MSHGQFSSLLLLLLLVVVFTAVVVVQVMKRFSDSRGVSEEDDNVELSKRNKPNQLPYSISRLPLPLNGSARMTILNICSTIPPLSHFPPGILPLMIDYVSIDGFIGNGEGDGDGELSWPNGIVFIDNLLYVADGYNSRIQVFRSDGSFVRKWGTRGRSNGQFRCPDDIAHANGMVYVSDIARDC